MKRRGNILVGDVVFIILALVFITMLFIFVAKQSSSSALVEEKAAKEIALAIDAAEPGTQITISVDRLFSGNKPEVKEPILINNEKRIVKVQLKDKSGYSYGFFSKKNVNVKLDNEYLTLEVLA